MAERYNFLPKGENPAADLKRQKVRPRDRYATKAEAQTLIDSCFDWLKPIVLTALHTGGRRGEVLGLTWQDVDFEGGRITFLDTKNGDVRKVPMSTLLRSTLKALPNRLKGGPVFVRGGAAVTKHMLRDGFDA